MRNCVIFCAGEFHGLAEPVDHMVLTNRLLDLLHLDSYEPSDEAQTEDLEEILAGILDYAVANGLCDDGITAKDIFDTRIMGAITPMPREVIRTFKEKYDQSPVEATDWYYKFSCDTDYIRRYRIAKDMRWKYASDYGEMDITINLSKPEKDPKAIAAAKLLPQSGYPKCLLCLENADILNKIHFFSFSKNNGCKLSAIAKSSGYVTLIQNRSPITI